MANNRVDNSGEALYINVNNQNVITYAGYSKMYYMWFNLLKYNLTSGNKFSVSAPKVGTYNGVVWYGVTLHLTKVN